MLAKLPAVEPKSRDSEATPPPYRDDAPSYSLLHQTFACLCHKRAMWSGFVDGNLPIQVESSQVDGGEDAVKTSSLAVCTPHLHLAPRSYSSILGIYPLCIP